MPNCFNTYLTKQETNTFKERLGRTRICGMGDPNMGLASTPGDGLNDDSRKLHQPKKLTYQYTYTVPKNELFAKNFDREYSP